MAVLATASTGCGKPSDEAGAAPIDSSPGITVVEPQDATSEKPVIGNGSFGAFCPHGSIQEPLPVKLTSWDCTMPVDKVEISQALIPLMLSADCKDKTLAIRTQDRSVNSPWNIMPDGSFYLTVEGLQVGLKSDGSGSGECITPVSVDLFGKLECLDQDRINIKYDAIWWLGKGPLPTTSAAPTPAVAPTQCKIPTGCYLHAESQVKQCQ